MSDEREQWAGRLQIFVAAVLWSSSGFFAKAPWFDAWPEDIRGLMLAFWRSFFAALILVPLIRRPRWQWPMLPMLICFPIMVWSFMSAMVHGPAANAIWLQYLAPAWVMVGGVLLMKEKVTAADVRMFLFCLGGVLLILVMEMLRGGSLYATAMGTLSGLSFAGVVLSMRSMRGADPAWLITLNHSVTALLLAPWVWQRGEQIAPSSYVALGLFGVFQMSVPYVLFARGLRSVSGPEASVLSLIEPVLVPIWVYLAWHQHPSYQAPQWWTWAGGGLILVGLLGRYLPPLLTAAGPRKRTATTALSGEHAEQDEVQTGR
jgi:DME family drug/metabolite transporter